MAGIGTVNAAIHNVNGTITPGDDPGPLTVPGYTQGPAGTLQIDIFSNAILVSLIVPTGGDGNVQLDGTLFVNLLPAMCRVRTSSP